MPTTGITTGPRLSALTRRAGQRRAGARGRPAYTEYAGSYDRRTRAYQHWRERLIDLLPLSPGDVVLDVGCGTGLCLPMLVDRVGPDGAVIAIDQSAEMLGLARRRVAEHSWRNVTLIESSIEDADIPVTADAALFCAVHDVVRSPQAVGNVVRHLRSDAWIAAGGGKWAPPWMVGVNLMVRATHDPFVADFEGFSDPLAVVRRSIRDLKVVDLTGGYLAVGQVATAA
jgi:SAM-dependent methyltransferase